MFLKKFVPSLYKALGVYLPLITTNCAVLGVALNNVKYEYSILESVVNGFATGVGYLIAIVLLAGIREKNGIQRYSGILPGYADRSAYGSTDGYCILWILRNRIGGRRA